MFKGINWRQALAACTLMLFTHCVAAEPLRLAVASNFQHTLNKIIEDFSATNNLTIKISAASSGKLFAQIVQGAPFDIFLSADKKRPERLEQMGRIVPGSRYTYAYGRLVLIGAKGIRINSLQLALQQSGDIILALGNPRTVPYGTAAKALLTGAGQWQKVRQVYGENVSQVLQFVRSGNAQLGLISHAQALALNHLETGAFLLLDESLYPPIEQQLVVLTANPSALKFVEYLKSEAAKQLIQTSGYGTGS